MAKLTDPMKLFITQALACFDTPTQVSEAVKEEFGVVVGRPQIQAYDPTKAAGRDISKKLRAIFNETREKFLDGAAKVPIGNQIYRLRALQKLHERAMTRGNIALAAQLLEQAAKEVGGAYTNTRKLQGGDPGSPPIGVKHEGTVKALTDADLERIAAGGSARTTPEA